MEAWNIYHHGSVPLSAPKIVCSDLTTGQLCSGGPWPKPLNTVPGRLDSAVPGNISTTVAPQYVFDPDRPGVLYYPAMTTGAVGVGCVDLENRSNCGFVALVPTGGVTSSVNGIGGVVASGGNVYGVATTGQLLCMVMATRTPCVGQPYTPVTVGSHDRPGGGQDDYIGAMSVINGKVFVSSSPESGKSTTNVPPELGCFDPATTTACTGWSQAHSVGLDAGYRALAVFPDYDTSAKVAGVCTGVSGPAQVKFTCYGIDGSTVDSPADINSLTPAATNVNSFNPETITAPNGELHSYFPFMGGPTTGSTSCYDWNHAKPCTGFPSPTGHPNINGGKTQDYGYTYDQATQCLLGLGDSQVLFSVNPVTGSAPCQRSGASATLDLSSFRCHGDTSDAGQTYTVARIVDVNLADINLAESDATVADPSGVIATPTFSPDGTIDLSGVSAASHPAITVTVHLALRNDNDFTSDHHPSLRVESKGDPSRICCLHS